MNENVRWDHEASLGCISSLDPSLVNMWYITHNLQSIKYCNRNKYMLFLGKSSFVFIHDDVNKT